MHGIGHAKTAERIKLPCGMVSGMGSKDRVLDGRIHWRHLTKTVERFDCAR